MTKLLITLSAALTLLTVAALLGAATARGGASTAACTSGPTTYHGVRAYRSCGPATAVARVGSRTVRFRGGTCRRTSTALELNIGTTVIGNTNRPLPRYFGVSVGRLFGVGKPARRDGTYSGGTLALVDRGKRLASFGASVVLAGGRTRGSFTARLIGGGSVSGTFRCA
jgi:hypothetical protein